MSLNLPDLPRPAPIGVYVHHHGSGHATRCKQIIAAWPDETPFHVFTSAPDRFKNWSAGSLHTLPMDTEEGRNPSDDLLKDQVLHYAPTGLKAINQRMATMANWIAKYEPKLFIVDLSCEIALFARLCGVKVALVRLHGYRRDAAHVAAFQLADVLLAPFPPCLEDAHTEDRIRDKTHYLGLFSRYDTRKDGQADCRRTLLGAAQTGPALESTQHNAAKRWQKHVAIINGSGGDHQRTAYWEEVARLNPDHHFYLIGKLDGQTTQLKNLTVVGYVVDTFVYLRGADIIVGSGGTNTMCEIAAASGRFLSIPEPRPFGEQSCKMKALERYGLTRAVPLDTAATEWRKWLRRANDLQPARWRRVRRSVKFQEAIRTLAQRYSGEGVGTAATADLLFGRRAK